MFVFFSFVFYRVIIIPFKSNCYIMKVTKPTFITFTKEDISCRYYTTFISHIQPVKIFLRTKMPPKSFRSPGGILSSVIPQWICIVFPELSLLLPSGHPVLKYHFVFCVDIVFGNTLAYIEGTAHTSGVTFTSDVFVFLILLFLVETLLSADGKVTIV